MYILCLFVDRIHLLMTEGVRAIYLEIQTMHMEGTPTSRLMVISSSLSCHHGLEIWVTMSFMGRRFLMSRAG